jgi:hypothetical protein
LNIRNLCRGQQAVACAISCWLGITLAAGCGGGAKVQRSTPTAAAFAPPDTLAARVFDFSQDTVVSPFVAQWPRQDTTSSGPGNEPAPGDPEEATMVYRVQLATSKDLSAAQSVRAKAQGEFKQEVHIDYEVPYYKVRVGVFVSPQAAEPLLQEARRLGYQGAWAVRVRASQQAP